MSEKVGGTAAISKWNAINVIHGRTKASAYSSILSLYHWLLLFFRILCFFLVDPNYFLHVFCSEFLLYSLKSRPHLERCHGDSCLRECSLVSWCHKLSPLLPSPLIRGRYRCLPWGQMERGGEREDDVYERKLERDGKKGWEYMIWCVYDLW